MTSPSLPLIFGTARCRGITAPGIIGGHRRAADATKGLASKLTTPEELIPREVLFGNPKNTSPLMSPDGKYLAYLAPSPDVRRYSRGFIWLIGFLVDSWGNVQLCHLFISQYLCISFLL